MKPVVIIFLLFFISSGCTRLILIKEGVKQPKLENYKSLSDFLIKLDIDTSELLCFKDTIALRQFYDKEIGVPESRFFNRNEQLVDYKESPKECNGSVSVFLEKAEVVNTKRPIQNESLEIYLKDLVYVNNARPFILEQEANDIFLVIYWAKYLGKVNKHKVFEWLELANGARLRGLKIRVIKVNVDYQQHWNLRESDLPHFKY